MNKIRKMIIDLEAKPVRDEMDEKRLEILRCKQEELGENPTEAEVTRAVADVLKTFIMMIVKRKQESDGCVDADDGKTGNSINANYDERPEADDVDWLDDEDDKQVLHLDLGRTLDLSGDTTAEIDQIRDIFREIGLHFCDFEIKEGIHVFDGTVCADKKWLVIRLYVESDPKMLRMDVKYPFFAKRTLAPFLCEKLIKENYPRRFGALLYDESDGELVYQYNLPMTLGLHKDEFLAIFMALTKGALDSYDTVFRYALGDFDEREKKILAARATVLANMLE